MATRRYTARKTLKKGRAAWKAESRRAQPPSRLPASVLAGARLWAAHARETLRHTGRHPDDYPMMEEHSLTFAGSEHTSESAPVTEMDTATLHNPPATPGAHQGHSRDDGGKGADGASAGGGAESAEARVIREAEATIPWGLVGVLGASWLIVLGLALLRGGHGGAPLLFPVPCAGFVYWLLIATTLLAMLVVTAAVASHLHALHQRKVRVGYTYLESDVIWAGHNLRVLPLLTVGSGVGAGLLGIGGGMVMGRATHTVHHPHRAPSLG